MIIAVSIDTKNLILIKVLSFVFGKIYVQNPEDLASNTFDGDKRVAAMSFSPQFPCRGVRDFDYGPSKRLDEIENYIDDTLGLLLTKTFPDIKDVRRKIALIAACSAPYHATGHAIYFAKSILGLKGDKVTLLHNNWRSFICATCHNSEGILLRHIYLPLNDLYRLGSFLLAAVGNLVRRVKGIGAFKNSDTYDPTSEKVTALVACRSAETATIFHLSQSYSNLYQKNHYFSDDVKSRLHRSKVVPLVNLRHEQIGPSDKDLIPLFGVGGVIVRPLDFLNLAPLVLGLALRIRSIGQILIAVTLIETYFKYRIYRGFFKRTTLKNVIIDYDILFSKPLSLALESLGINTIGLQERPSSSFGSGVYGCISNQYLYAGELYRSHGESARSSIICGQPHSFSPWRLKYFTEVNARQLKDVRIRSAAGFNLADFENIIVVLGYWLSDKQVSPIINKYSTEKFLKDVLLIGETFPKSSVVVRMKAVEARWSESMLDIFAKQSNIFLCDDYSDFGISYLLCRQADVIVSVQTSLAEECLAYGKSVILLDDYGTAKGVCSDIYPEDFHFAIASSDVEVLRMISLCLAKDTGLVRKYQELAASIGACREADSGSTSRAIEALLVS